MTGEERLEALIVAAMRTRGWTRAYAESNAWAWLSKESGVMVRWEFMTLEQRWNAEAVLERHAVLTRPIKKIKRKAFAPSAPIHLPPLSDDARESVRMVLSEIPHDVWDVLDGSKEGRQITTRMELGQVG